ncbi:hypothetical protein [Gandjariella thermophila]|uniref:Uncharacterized protein n=1 Tax=Gandjariella thermophila TaxID=1931992 RepID=A0A4D4JGK6_9PSEU|nr:hypothetical protein [Gandjariella thermophila]GDY33027.1 hypothetical protein GTS_46600 [Gandjariella thermophila]
MVARVGIGTVLGLVYLAGIVTSGLVYLQRAGFGELKSREGVDWREFLLPNIPYFALTLAKMFVWPAVLLFWLVMKMPRSPWRAITDDHGRAVRRVTRVGGANTGH